MTTKIYINKEGKYLCSAGEWIDETHPWFNVEVRPFLEGEHVLIDDVPPSWKMSKDSLIVAVANIVEASDAKVVSKIVSGFTSKALGGVYKYSSATDDQQNLLGSVIRASKRGSVPYACRDVDGVKAFRMHTAEQMEEVGEAFSVHVESILMLFGELKLEVDSILKSSISTYDEMLNDIKDRNEEFLKKLDLK